MFKISLLHGTCTGGSKQQHHTSTSAGSSSAPAPASAADSAPAGSLQPQQSQQQHQHAAAAPGSTSSLSVLLEPRDWAMQARHCTANLLDASKYKSMAVYAEVKLAEALDLAAKACPDALDQDGELLPNRLQTAVCCQLLGELAGLCGPFSGTLLKLRNALIPAVYSSYAAQTGAPLQFDTMPWFAVAEQLRGDNSVLQANQEAFKQELQQHEAQMAAVEQQLLTFKAAMDAGEAAAAVLQAANAELAAARETAEEEAAAASDEAKKLTAEVARLKEELNEAQEHLGNAKDLAAQDQEQWERQLAALKKQLHVEAQEREAAVALAAARLTPTEGQELEQRCAEAEHRLEEAESRLAAAAAAAAVAAGSIEQQQQLTPRPTDWGSAQELADKCKATQETVRQLLQQHASSLALLQRRVSLLQALAQPDPAPQPWQLNLKAESSNYFITEAAVGNDAAVSVPKLFAEPLGLGPDVPRFLRWNEPVELQDVGLCELQSQVASIWQQHAAFEARHGPCHLQTFLYHFCSSSSSSSSTVFKNQKQQQRQEEEEAAEGSSGTTNDSNAGGQLQALDAAAEQAAAVAAAVAAAGYSLYHACCSHRHDSVAVDTLWHVLTGQLPHELVHQQRQLLQHLVVVLWALCDAAEAAGIKQEDSDQPRHNPGVTVENVGRALRFLFPLKQQEQLEQLTGIMATLAAAEGPAAAGEAAAASSSGGSRGTGGSRGHISCSSLFGVAAALLPGDSSGCWSAAENRVAAALAECVLRQQLEAVAAHTEQLCDHVLQHAGAIPAAGSSASHNIVQQLAAVLSGLGEAGSAAPTRASGLREAAGQAAACDLSLVAAAAAAVARAGQGVAAASVGGGSAIGGVNANSNLSIQRWLATVEQCCGHASSSSCFAEHSGSRPHSSGSKQCLQEQPRPLQQIQLGQVVAWLRRECLLQPVTCAVDAAGAVQWCKTAFKRQSSGA